MKVRHAFIVFSMITLRLLAPDNVQAISSPRGGITFTPIGPDVGRGPAGYTFVRTWTSAGVGSFANLVLQNPDGSTTSSGNTDFI